MRSHVIQLTILLDLSGSMTEASDRNTESADLATIFHGPVRHYAAGFCAMKFERKTPFTIVAAVPSSQGEI